MQRRSLGFFGTLLFTGIASAQQPQIGSATVHITTLDQHGVREVTCADFIRYDGDGTWHNNKAITINGAMIVGTVVFVPGVKTDDVDIAAQLDAMCLKKH